VYLEFNALIEGVELLAHGQHSSGKLNQELLGQRVYSLKHNKRMKRNRGFLFL
jgi:hypothetical protein